MMKIASWVLGLALTSALQGPAALAFLPPEHTGRLYVSNYGSNAIGVYENGAFLRALTPSGLVQPRGIVFLPNGQFMVASQTNHTIFHFRRDESVLRTFSHPELLGPTGMAIHDGLLYVSSFNNDQIVVFDLEGNYQFDFLGGQLNGPNCVAFDAQGFLYVTSALTGTVIKYDPSQIPDILPQVVDVFTAEAPVSLVSPMSIARNADDVLYISGGSSQNIVKFSTSGETLGEIPLPGFAPQGLAFDDNGHLFTCSFNNVPYQILEFDENDVQVGDPITEGGLTIPRSLAFDWGLTGPDIPATSGWTLAALVLALCTAGAWILRRRGTARVHQGS